LANSALSNKIIQDVSRKTVIREIPEDIPLQEEIEIENLNLLIFNAFRATTKKTNSRIPKQCALNSMVKHFRKR